MISNVCLTSLVAYCVSMHIKEKNQEKSTVKIVKAIEGFYNLFSQSYIYAINFMKSKSKNKIRNLER